MTTLREAAQMALTALLQSCDPKHGYRRNELFLQPKPHIEIYQETIEALRAALTAPPEELDLPKVQLWEFLKLIEGKEDFRGIPLMRTEWPTREET